MSKSNLSEPDNSAKPQLEGLLDEHAVAQFYHVSVATIRRWRWLRTGPKFHKLGASVRYRLADLEAYLHTTPTGGELPARNRLSKISKIGLGTEPEAQ